MTTAKSFFGPTGITRETLDNPNTSKSVDAIPRGPGTMFFSNVSGLGGIDINTFQPKSLENKLDDTKVKEVQVPDQIIKLVDVLKEHIKREKKYSSDIGSTSATKLFTVGNEIQAHNWAREEITNMLDNNYSQIKLLRNDTSKVMQYSEMAQRTQDTPSGLQFENVAPFQYFSEVVNKYEIDLIEFRNQVKQTEKHMHSLTNPQSFHTNDFKRCLNQIHESFIALAGRLHEIHQKIEVEKSRYLNLRKHFFRDLTNVFAEIDIIHDRKTKLRTYSGPTPFFTSPGLNYTSDFARGLKNSAIQALDYINGPFPWKVGKNFVVNSVPVDTAQVQSSILLYGGDNTNTGLGKTVFTTNLDSFNLQSPPIGTKRNKS